MKNVKIILLAAAVFIAFGSTKAQFANNLANGDAIIGIGWNIVDDNGQKFENVFELDSSWNVPAYPSAFRVEKGFNKAMSFVFTGSYNKYKVSKRINGEIQNEESLFYAFDFGIKYNFLHAKSEVIDLYGVFGFGATHRDTYTVGNEATANLSIGMNAYIYKGFGINIDASSKFGVDDFWETNVNYTQYSIGVIYKLHSSGKYYSSKRFN